MFPKNSRTYVSSMYRVFLCVHSGDNINHCLTSLLHKDFGFKKLIIVLIFLELLPARQKTFTRQDGAYLVHFLKVAKKV